MCYLKLFQHIANIRDLDRSIATTQKLMNAFLKKNSAAIVNAFMFFSHLFEKRYNQTFRIFKFNEIINAVDMSVALTIDMNKLFRAENIFRFETLFDRRFIIEKTTEDIFCAIDCFEKNFEFEFNRVALHLHELAYSQKKL